MSGNGTCASESRGGPVPILPAGAYVLEMNLRDNGTKFLCGSERFQYTKNEATALKPSLIFYSTANILLPDYS